MRMTKHVFGNFDTVPEPILGAVFQAIKGTDCDFVVDAVYVPEIKARGRKRMYIQY